MIKKIDTLYISFMFVIIIPLLFLVSFIVIKKAYADIVSVNSINIESKIHNEDTSSKLGLRPDVSYYRYYLDRAIKNRS